jgi:hypothetical protein
MAINLGDVFAYEASKRSQTISNAVDNRLSFNAASADIRNVFTPGNPANNGPTSRV